MLFGILHVEESLFGESQQCGHHCHCVAQQTEKDVIRHDG